MPISIPESLEILKPKTLIELRSFFLQEGIKGKKKNAYECVVAEWFKKKTELDISVAAVAVVICEMGPNNIVLTIHDIPPTVQRFIYRFDRGDYPELLQQ